MMQLLRIKLDPDVCLKKFCLIIQTVAKLVSEVRNVTNVNEDLFSVT